MSFQPIPDPLPITTSDTTATVSIAANATSSGAVTSPGGAGTLVVQLTGTWVGTVQVQISRDGINWVNVTGSSEVQNAATGAYLASGNITSTGTNGNGIYQVNVTGVAGARVITTAYSSGTVAGITAITPTNGLVSLEGAPAVTLGGGSSTTLAANSAITGTSIYTGSIAATATAVKTSFGKVLGWHIYNSNSSAVYVQFFNVAAGSVTVGTTAPVMSVGIPATTAVSAEQLMGWGFLTAITVAATTTRAGATAPSNTVDLNIAYI